jgi:hypothetical protein
MVEAKDVILPTEGTKQRAYYSLAHPRKVSFTCLPNVLVSKSISVDITSSNYHQLCSVLDTIVLFFFRLCQSQFFSG